MYVFKWYVGFVLLLCFIMGSGAYFEKEQIRLCISEAIQAKYSVKDAKEMCGLL